MAVDAPDLEGRALRLLTRAAPVGLPTLLVAFLTLRAIVRRVGHAGASLDDTYIHFQYARAMVEGHPMRFQAGEPISTGATSQLWPAVLAPFYAMGFHGDALMWPAWALSFACLAALAYETTKLARGLVSEAVAVGAGAMVLTFGGYVWCAASGMEVVPFAWLLARSARRGAEWCEARPSGRTRGALLELVALAVATPLMRPEGALASVLLALAVLSNPRRAGLVGRLEGLAPLLGLALTPLLLLVLTGKATSSTTQVKLALGNPYHPLVPTFTANARLLFRTLLNGEVWSSEFLPRGGAGVAVAGLVAVSLRGVMTRKVDRAMAVLALALAMFAPCAYVTFLANRLRYLWPFAAGWLIGLACLAELVGALVGRARRSYALAGPALAFGFAGMFAMRLDWVIDDVANSASAIARQHGQVARYVREELPKNARVGLNDTGAIAYFGERRTFDIVGLTTPSEARYWVGGAAARFEHYERLARSPALAGGLPSHFAVYPEWLACPPVLGERLFESTVRDASILGGVSMQVFRADYTLLGTGEAPLSPFPPVLDALDVGDLESEADHRYALLGAAEGEQIAEAAELSAEGVAARRVADGGRTNRRRERFLARLAPGRRHVGLVRVRAASDGDGDVTVRVLAGGRDVGGFTASTAEWAEERFEIPGDAARALTEVTLVAAHGALTTFHYWFADAEPR